MLNELRNTLLGVQILLAGLIGVPFLRSLRDADTSALPLARRLSD